MISAFGLGYYIFPNAYADSELELDLEYMRLFSNEIQCLVTK